jgi:hypothetical protein
MVARLKFGEVVIPRQLEQFIDNQAEFIQEVAADVFEQSEDFVLRVLQQEPDVRQYPSDYPIEWESRPQERFVKGFILQKDSQGNIIPYKRSGRLARSWGYGLKNVTKGVKFFFKNPTRIAKYVYGSASKVVTNARKFQQRFHAITGWPLIIVEAFTLIDIIKAEFKETAISKIKAMMR